MTVEIELKFIASAQAAAGLSAQLAAWPHQHTAPQKLTNIYYETADNFLRRHDIGLRIRGCNQQYEMTIKPLAAWWAGCISARNTMWRSPALN